jgi:hypothetical protein
MAYYVEKPVIYEIFPWRRNGDIAGDGVVNQINEGKIVGYYVDPHDPKSRTLANCVCGTPLYKHGLLRLTGEMVCPGDWIRVHRDERKKIIGYSVLTAKMVADKLIPIPPIVPDKTIKGNKNERLPSNPRRPA